MDVLSAGDVPSVVVEPVVLEVLPVVLSVGEVPSVVVEPVGLEVLPAVLIGIDWQSVSATLPIGEFELGGHARHWLLPVMSLYLPAGH